MLALLVEISEAIMGKQGMEPSIVSFPELPPAGKEHVDGMLNKVVANWETPNNGYEHILPAYLYPCAEHPESTSSYSLATGTTK